MLKLTTDIAADMDMVETVVMEVTDTADTVASDLPMPLPNILVLDTVPQSNSDTIPDTILDTTRDTTPDTTPDTTLDTTPDTIPDTIPDTDSDTTLDTTLAVAIMADRFL